MHVAAHEAPGADGRQIARLLGELRQQKSDTILPRLLRWLAEAIDGHAMLTTPDGEALAQSSPAAREACAPTTHMRQRIASGELDSAVVDDGHLKAHLLPIGVGSPHAVLTVTRSANYSTQDKTLVSCTADLITLLTPKVKVDQDLPRLRQTAAELGSAILQLLMSGQVAIARRTAARMYPDLLTDTVRVAVIECGSTDRDSATEAMEAALSGARHAHLVHPRPRALVTHCPAYDNHVIVVVPANTHDETEKIAAALRDIVAQLPDHYLGMSKPTDIDLTADAYRDACRALTVARRTPTRTYDYAGHSGVVAVLDAHARSWAESFLRPLLSVPWAEREQFFHTLRLSLSFPATQAAKLLGVHRNTVAGRVKRASDLLRLDFGDIRARALLDLALQINARVTDTPQPPIQGCTSLEQLLSTPAAVSSAEMLLAPLEADTRDLRRTLVAWLARNTDADAAGADLGMHAQTVRNHLRRAEQALERELLGGAYEAHDLVIALFIAGDIPTLPTDKPSLSPVYLTSPDGHSGIDTLPLGWMEEEQE